MAKAKSFDIFGLRTEQEIEDVSLQGDENELSFAKPHNNDGALVVDDQSFGSGGNASNAISFHAEYSTEKELINLYRKIAQNADVESAIDDVINDTIVMNTEDNPVEILVDNIEASDKIKDVIRDEFEYILKLLKFNTTGDDKFRKWYVDGRQYHHMIVNSKRPEDGIKELREVDPRYIQLIREIHRKRTGQFEVIRGIREYYLYSDPKMGSLSQGLEIKPESICYVHSGLVDAEKQSQSIHGQYEKDVIISHLHKSIKPFNRLNQLEDSLVIYRISRAPERLVFYVDVGNMNKSRSEQFMKENMQKYKNKMVYDSNTGKVKNDRHIMSVMENMWLPRKMGSRGTEISSLSGAMNLGNIDDVAYFKRKLLESLKRPTSRLEQEGGGMMGGRTSEITRDELKFTKFTRKLAKHYSKTFNIILKTQLILKKVCTQEDWDLWKDEIEFKFNTDSYFDEIKEQEIWAARFETLQSAGVENPIGKYKSNEWVMKTLLRMSEDEIKDEQKLISSEKENKVFNPPEEEEPKF